MADQTASGMQSNTDSRKPPQGSLARKSLTALKWNYAGTVARTLAGLMIGIILARLLGPAPFGEVAIASLVIGLASLVADFGFSAALIQRDTLGDTDIRFVFTTQVVLGVLLTLLIAFSAGPIAAAFHAHDAAKVVRALAPIFLIQAAGITATGLLKRQLEFRVLQLSGIGTYLISYVAIGIPMAFLGFGVWSLVVAQLMQSSLNTLIVFAYVRHPVKPVIRGPFTFFVGFGSKVIALNLVNWVTGNLDNLLVGKSFGVIALGLYSRAFILTFIPMNSVVASMQGVLLSSASRAQDRPETLRRVTLASTELLSLLLMPTFLTIALVPHTVMDGLYGARWSGAIPILPPLALAMPLYAIMAIPGPVLTGIGAVGQELRAQIISTCCATAMLLVASRFDLTALAWAVFGAYLIRMLLVIAIAIRVQNIPWSMYGRTFVGPLGIAGATAFLVWNSDRLLARARFGPSFRLMVDAGIGGVTLLALSLVLLGTIVSEPGRWAIAELCPRLPAPASRFVYARLQQSFINVQSRL